MNCQQNKLVFTKNEGARVIKVRQLELRTPTKHTANKLKACLLLIRNQDLVFFRLREAGTIIIASKAMHKAVVGG